MRLVFRSRATTVELDTLRTRIAYRGAPPRPDGVYALLDAFTARAPRDTPADLSSVRIGINLVTTDLMRLRAAPAVHGFLDTIREGHPTLLLGVSSFHCPLHENIPPAPASPTSALESCGSGPRGSCGARRRGS